MNKILEIKNLSKDFYTINGEVNAIKNVTFDLYKEEFLCIVGPSGCGKSSLLNIIAGLDCPTNGEINYLKNQPVIGYMLQNDALLPWLNIIDNATLGLKILKKKNKTTLKYTEELLRKYGLENFMHKYPDQLSGGMKQRVALIRTLAIKPDILLLDEPFSALDYQTRLTVSKDVYEILKKEKKTVIMITHDIEEAISLSDRIIVLSQRPSVINKIQTVEINKSLTTLERKKEPKYREYFDSIWCEIK